MASIIFTAVDYFDMLLLVTSYGSLDLNILCRVVIFSLLLFANKHSREKNSLLHGVYKIMNEVL